MDGRFGLWKCSLTNRSRKKKITREHRFNAVKVTEKTSEKIQNVGGEMRSEISGGRPMKSSNKPKQKK